MARYESSLNIILLANEPRIFRELLHRALDATPETRLVVEVEDLARLPSILDRVQARWLFVTLDDKNERPPLVRRLLNAYPQLSIVMVSADGGHVKIAATTPNGMHSHAEYDHMNLAELLEVISSEEHSLSA